MVDIIHVIMMATIGIWGGGGAEAPIEFSLDFWASAGEHI